MQRSTADRKSPPSWLYACAGCDVKGARSRGAQVAGDGRRRHDDLGVEHAGRIPEIAEVREGGAQVRAELALQQRATGPPVAVLAGQRAAVRHDEVRRGLHEALEALLAAGAVQAEADAQVDAALAVVAVADGRQAVLAEQGAQRAQVAASRSGGTAESSKPGQAATPSASRDE